MIALTAGLAAATAALTPSFAELRKDHRALIVAARSVADHQLIAQRHALADWRGAAERDVRVVEIVAGVPSRAFADDPLAVLRRYDLPADRFGIALIGKDGHVAYLATEPVSGDRLQALIDAMPMRRAGQR